MNFDRRQLLGAGAATGATALLLGRVGAAERAANPRGKRKLTFATNFRDGFRTTPDGGDGAWRTGFHWGRKQQHELGAYTDPRLHGTNPTTLVDGHLALQVERRTVSEGGQSHPYSQPLISTHGLASWKYGYFELRCRIPQAPGTVPAWWMGADSGGWPPEIDMFEFFQREGERVPFQVTEIASHEWRPYEKIDTASVPFDPFDWNVYGFEWTKDTQTSYINDKKVFARENRIHEPMFNIISIGVGLQVPPPPASLRFPVQMPLDYFRVWQ